MTVKELIEELQKYPPEMWVCGVDVAGNDRPISIYKTDWMKEHGEEEHVIIDTD